MQITTLNTAKANGQGFGHIQRANTLAQAGLMGVDCLVDMQTEAIVITST
jgi:hypothetical protein